MPKTISCPQCKKNIPYQGNPHRPFCSKRCRMLDLGAWAEETYRVPVEESSQSFSDLGNSSENVFELKDNQ